MFPIHENSPNLVGEGVGMSKIRTSKDQNVESIFRMIRISKDQNIERSKHQKPEHQKECQKSKNDF